MIEGVIFDMDGVISDTQKLHSKVESDLLRRCGVSIEPKEITERYAGVRTQEFFAELLQNREAAESLESLIKEKWERMARAAEDGIDAVSGSVELIRALSDAGYPMAVASASNAAYVRTVLRKLDVIDLFSFIVSGDMVSCGKPDPESFLLAASLIGVSPDHCLVIEDGISGMEAARRGGMRCIGLVPDENAAEYPTDLLIRSLAEITPEYIRSL